MVHKCLETTPEVGITQLYNLGHTIVLYTLITVSLRKHTVKKVLQYFLRLFFRNYVTSQLFIQVHFKVIIRIRVLLEGMSYWKIYGI